MGSQINDFTIDNVSILEFDTELQTYAQTPVISDTINNTTATTLGDFAGKENLITYSEGAFASNWGNAATATDNTHPNPIDGALTASTLKSTSGIQHRTISVTIPTAGSYVFSVYLKKKTGSASVGIGDFTDGTVTQTVTDEWQRFSKTTTFSAGTHTFTIRVGDTDEEVFVWGAQLNSGSLKPYQATTSTALTGDVNVVNWYDQGGGGGEDATQDTASKQPRIVMGSELVTDSGGKASLYFDGGDTLQNSTLAGQNRLDIYAIQDTSDDPYLYPADPTNGSNFAAVADDGSGESNIEDNFGTPSYYVNGALQSFSDRDDVHDALTGSTKLFSQHNASTSSWGNLEVGHYGGSINSTYNYTGKISEMVFFPNMDSSPKRFPIEQNMLRHFDVNLVTNGTFDSTDNWTVQSHWSVSGGVAIYNDTGNSALYQSVSFKQGSSYRLRFNISNASTTARLWIGNLAGTNAYVGGGYQSLSNGSYDYTFTVSQDESELKFFAHTDGGTFSLDNVVLEQVGTAGYVTKLFDQSGNNSHALQSTAAYQPQIVRGGSLTKSGGHPAWEHVTASNMLMEGKIQAAHLDAWFVAETNDNTYMYPANYATVSDHGFVSQDGSTSVALIADYGGGDAKLYANGNLIGSSGSNTRDEVHTALNGRKLVHHQDADTADWAKLQMGYYGSTSNSTFNFQGKFSEWIWYDSSQSSNRTSIDTAINTHYNIY